MPDKFRVEVPLQNGVEVQIYEVEPFTVSCQDYDFMVSEVNNPQPPSRALFEFMRGLPCV